MKKRQTIFKKYLYISMLVFFAGLLILGVMIVFFVTRYWENDRWDSMKKSATSVSVSVTENASFSGGIMSFEKDDELAISTTVGMMSDGINADIFVTDHEGNILFCSYGRSGINEASVIDQSYVQRAEDKTLREISTLGNIYESKYYVIGVPVQTVGTNGLYSVGAVFVTSSAAHYTEYVATLIKLFCSVGIVIFALMFCVVGAFSYKLTKPLRQMAAAAKAFGNGDFSIRVKAGSNDEIGELAEAFNSMADSLASSEGMRRSFVANVSHELKTPMTTIAGFIDGILDGTIPPDRQSYYLNIVTVEIKSLSRLVTSMLALSRIDSGELKLVTQTFDISDTVLNTFLTFEQKIEERNINIIGLGENKPVFIEGDPDMIHQVIYNLVENAAKFTNVGGDITATVEEKGSDAYVTIKNTGPGISKEQIKFIFDRFYKTDQSRSHDKNGMGLGLYIVKTIVRLHGGEIKADSVEGEYTRFVIRLPKKKEGSGKRAAKDKENKNNEPQEGK